MEKKEQSFKDFVDDCTKAPGKAVVEGSQASKNKVKGKWKQYVLSGIIAMSIWGSVLNWADNLGAFDLNQISNFNKSQIVKLTDMGDVVDSMHRRKYGDLQLKALDDINNTYFIEGPEKAGGSMR